LKHPIRKNHEIHLTINQILNDKIKKKINYTEGLKKIIKKMMIKIKIQSKFWNNYKKPSIYFDPVFVFKLRFEKLRFLLNFIHALTLNILKKSTKKYLIIYRFTFISILITKEPLEHQNNKIIIYNL
jgi:hypothetical protein